MTHTRISALGPRQTVCSRGQSDRTFYNLGRCKIKSLNCSSNDIEKCNPGNMLGCCVPTLRPTKGVKISIGLAPDQS